MKKNKPKYHVAQVGIQIDNSVNDPAKMLGNVQLPLNRQVPGTLPTAYPQPKKKFNPNDLLNMANGAIVGITAIANSVNSHKATLDEQQQYQRAIQPEGYNNMERYSLNTNPAYMQAGGTAMTPKYSIPGIDNAEQINNPSPNPTHDQLSELRMSELISQGINHDGNFMQTPDGHFLFGAMRDRYGVGHAQKMVTDMNLFKQDPSYMKMSPVDRVRAYSSYGDPSLSQFKQRMNSFGYGAADTYQNTNFVEGQGQQGRGLLATKQMGGDVQQTSGVSPQQANVEAERGEVVQHTDGDITQVDPSGNTHEQGGVFLPAVHRVLENTSNLRKDKNSKYLKLEPQQLKAIVGLDSNKSMSHAEALVKANEAIESERNKIVKNIALSSRDRDILDNYGEASAKLNVEHFKSLPTKQELFDRLFNHQEQIKAKMGIKDSGHSKYGGICFPKMQYGGKYNTDPFNTNFLGATPNSGYLPASGYQADAPTTATAATPPNKIKFKNSSGYTSTGLWAGDNNTSTNNQTGKASTNWNAMRKYKSLQEFAKAVKYDGPINMNDIPGTSAAIQRHVMKYYPEVVIANHSPTTGYGQPNANRPDDGKIGIRWDNIAAEIAGLPSEAPQANTPNQPADAINLPAGSPSTAINNNLQRIGQPQSKFNEPLRWFDVASSIGTFLNSDRLSEKYNPAEFHQLQLKLQDPTAALNQNQADFNTAIQAVQNTSPENAGVQLANIQALTSRKYALNNQVLGNTENQNSQIKNQEIMYNTAVRDKQSQSDQQSRAIFEENVLTGKAKQQEQKLTALDSLYKTIAENRALNRNGNLIMKFSKAFDQYGNYNGYQSKFSINPQMGMQQAMANPATTITPDSKGKGNNSAGGLQGLSEGKQYYNRKTGKTYEFRGGSLMPIQ